MSRPLQPTFRFDSSDYPERKSFETWREVISATHDVAPSRVTPSRFQVTCRLWHLGQMMITSGQFSAQTFVRDQQRIRLDQLDQYGLFAQEQGQRVGNIGDDEYNSRPGDLQIFDLAQLDTSSTGDGSSGTLYLPRDLVDEVIPDFSRFHGVILRDGASRLLAQHILAMGHYLESMPGDTLPGITRATMEMALSCLDGATAGHAGTGATYESALRRQVERYVDANLGDPELAIESICSAFGISRSTLYRLFNAHSGVANS